MPTPWRASAAAVLVAATMTVEACSAGAAEPESSSPRLPPPAAEAADADPTGQRADREELSEFFGFVRYRYTKLARTEDLADGGLTRTGVRGTVVRFDRGPQLWHDGGPSSGTTMVMTVRVESTFKGTSPAPKTARVLLPLTGNLTPADFARVLPAGTPLVAYLGTPHDFPEEDLAGLMSSVSPQGLVVDTPTGIVFPLDPELNSDETLAQQVPD